MLSYLITEYKCLLSTARYFRRQVDTTGWPPHWEEVHARDAEHARHWWQRAMVVKQQIRALVKGPEYSL